MRITSWNCLCRDVSRRLSDLAPVKGGAKLDHRGGGKLDH